MQVIKDQITALRNLSGVEWLLRQMSPFPWKLHPYIWVTFEAFLAYLLQPAGSNIGSALHPATDDLGLLREAMRLMDVYVTPSRAHVLSRAHVISSDLEQVGLDLSRVPLDDVLEFRDRHGTQYRDYTNKLRLFMMEIAPMDELERTRGA